jgi:hypothetical protein
LSAFRMSIVPPRRVYVTTLKFRKKRSFEERAACSVVGEAALRGELVLKSQLTTQAYGPTLCNAVLFETLLVF